MEALPGPDTEFAPEELSDTGLFLGKFDRFGQGPKSAI